MFMIKKLLFILCLTLLIISCSRQDKISVSTNISTDKREVLCINTASEAELIMVLPGVGVEKAKKIISSRNEVKFKSKYDLLERRIVGESAMKKIVKEVEVICNN